MKGFAGTLVMCLVCCFVLTFFFGAFLLSNIWGATAVFAILLAVLIHWHERQSAEIEALEERIRALEGNEAQENEE